MAFFTPELKLEYFEKYKSLRMNSGRNSGDLYKYLFDFKVILRIFV